jgi:MarR family transcriptional regulator, organic hydroperoxide resistance regulator
VQPQRTKIKKTASARPSITSQACEIDRTLVAIRQILRKPLSKAFAEGDLTGAQQAVMRALLEATVPISLNALRLQLGLAQSTVSGITERLVRRGLVTRETDPRDGRGTLLAPSRPVRDFLERKAPELIQSPLADALRLAAPRKRYAILKAVHSLRALLEQATASRNA